MTDTSNKIFPPPERSSRSHIFYAIFLNLFFLLFFSSPSDGDESKKVLVLHSYHQGLVWTDDIMEGIYSVFNKSVIDTEIFIEYMDTKRYFDGPGGKYVERLREMYKDKYGAIKMDVIISSDDNAFQFLLRHHDELFPGTPIVFCGVNRLEDTMLAGHDTHITGVIEFLDKRANIDLALALHPESDKVVIITDTSTTGTGNRRILEGLADEYRGRAEFTFIDRDHRGLTLQELLERLKDLEEGSVVYYSDFLRSGETYIIQETAVPQISMVSGRPVYTHYDEILGLGVVGGKLVNGRSHGRTAAHMAIDILEGTPAGSIPVHKESINTFMFDYLQLQRFDINEDNLPERSIVINRPFSFYNRYKYLVWSVSGVFVLLLLSLIAISVNVGKRKKAEQELKKAHDELEQKVNNRTNALSRANAELEAEITERTKAEAQLVTAAREWRNTFDSITDSISIHDRDFRILRANKALCQLTGLDAHDLIGRHCYEVFHNSTGPVAGCPYHEMIESKQGTTNEIYEQRMDKHLMVSVSPIIEGGEINAYVHYVKDITGRKMAEEQIRRSLEEKAMLLQEIHHRVKNNMTVIHSLLELQSGYIHDSRDREMFHESMNRIKSMALIHERLYHSEDLSNIDFNEYLNTMLESMFQSYGLTAETVSLRTDISGVALGIGAAIPCGLIVNELVSNALKYAFPEGRKGEVTVALRIIDNDEIALSVGDNGIGIPPGLDYRHSKTLGLNLVNALVRQLKGTIELDRDMGTEFRITFMQSE